MIYDIAKKDYPILIEIWESSVRATHHFLSAEEILRLKNLVLNKYFDAVLLRGYKDEQGKLLGFCGILDQKIEMLFVDSKAQGQGIGILLCNDAISRYAVTKVDVNEQNPQAEAFYKKMGFKLYGRSELDSDGKPYPILHMGL